MNNRILVLSALLIPQLALAQAQQQPRLWSERAPGLASPAALLPDFSTLAEQLVPSVVSIQVDQKIQARAQQLPHEFFFGPEVPCEYRNRGLGSGFFISKDGLILTNYHVVENAERIEVTYSTKDGTEKTLTGKVLGTAPDYDVALVQATDINDAPVAYLGDSDSVRIGQ